MISSRGLVDRMCQSGSLSDHENVRGGLAMRGERASWERELRVSVLEERDVFDISEM